MTIAVQMRIPFLDLKAQFLSIQSEVLDALRPSSPFTCMVELRI